MKKPLISAVALSLLALMVPARSEASPERQAQALLDALRWQGVSSLRDGAQKLPVQADTRFRLASVSKLFAATAATRDWMWQPVLDNAGQPVVERSYKMGFGWRRAAGPGQLQA